jgi:hypothetical protein
MPALVTSPQSAIHYTRLDNTSPQIAYRGNWTTRQELLASGGSVASLSDPMTGDANVSWDGRAVRVLVTTGPKLGRAFLVVDGVPYVAQLLSDTWIHQQVALTLENLPAGHHTLIVSVDPRPSPSITGSPQEHRQHTIELDAVDVG